MRDRVDDLVVGSLDTVLVLMKGTLSLSEVVGLCLLLQLFERNCLISPFILILFIVRNQRDVIDHTK